MCLLYCTYISFHCFDRSHLHSSDVAIAQVLLDFPDRNLHMAPTIKEISVPVNMQSVD